MFRSVKNYIRPGAEAPAKNEAAAVPRPFAPMSTSPTPQGSRPGIGYKQSSAINYESMSEMSAAVNLMRMAQIQQRNMWVLRPYTSGEGAVLKVKPNEFISYPETLKSTNDPFFHAASELNARVSPGLN